MGCSCEHGSARRYENDLRVNDICVGHLGTGRDPLMKETSTAKPTELTSASAANYTYSSRSHVYATLTRRTNSVPPRPLGVHDLEMAMTATTKHQGIKESMQQVNLSKIFKFHARCRMCSVTSSHGESPDCPTEAARQPTTPGPEAQKTHW